jgi:hypothetical protein
LTFSLLDEVLKLIERNFFMQTTMSEPELAIKGKKEA